MARRWRTPISGTGGIARSYAQVTKEQGERLARVAAVDNAHWRFSALPNATDEERAALVGFQAPGDDAPPSHGTQLAAFLDAMDRGERPLTSGPEARRTIEFLISLYKSAVTGQPVRRGSIRPGDPFHAQIAGTAAQPAGASGG